VKITLKAARVNKELTAKEASELLNINVATLRNYEKGVTIPNWNIVKQIENLYGISADDIFLPKKLA